MSLRLSGIVQVVCGRIRSGRVSDARAFALGRRRRRRLRAGVSGFTKAQGGPLVDLLMGWSIDLLATRLVGRLVIDALVG